MWLSGVTLNLWGSYYDNWEVLFSVAKCKERKLLITVCVLHFFYLGKAIIIGSKVCVLTKISVCCCSCLCPWDSMFSTVTVTLGLWEMAPCISLCLPPSTHFLSCPPHPLLTLLKEGRWVISLSYLVRGALPHTTLWVLHVSQLLGLHLVLSSWICF